MTHLSISLQRSTTQIQPAHSRGTRSKDGADVKDDQVPACPLGLLRVPAIPEARRISRARSLVRPRSRRSRPHAPERQPTGTVKRRPVRASRLTEAATAVLPCSDAAEVPGSPILAPPAGPAPALAVDTTSTKVSTRYPTRLSGTLVRSLSRELAANSVRCALGNSEVPPPLLL